jgi:iron complex outermembrane recepter protein
VDYTYDWSRSADSQAYLTYTGPQIPGAEPPSSSFPDRSSMPFYITPFITEASGHSLTAAWTVSDHITLKSISSYRKVSKVGYANLGTPNNLGPAFGLPLDPQDAIYYIADQDTHQHQYSEEAQLLGSWARLQLTAGAVYYAERGNQIFHTSFFSGPGLAALGLPDFRPGAPSATRVRSNSLGLYLQGTYTPPILDDKLALTAGVRYADDDKVAVRYLGPGDPLGTTTIALDEHVKASAKRADPAFTVQYNFSPRANVYFRYAQAYRAGGVSVRSISFRPYEPEVTKSIELGFKAQTADRHFTFDGALYQNKIYNPQFDVEESPILTQTTITINAPVVRRVRGVEFESTYRTPIPGLSLSTNLSFLRVHQPSFLSPTDSPAGLVSALPLFTPKFTGSINADYTRSVGFGALTLHADYSHSSGFYVGGEINPAGYQTPTDPIIVRQLNARLTLDKLAIAGGVSFSLWVKNLLDRHDVLYAYHVPDDNVHSFNYLTDPRTFGIDVRYHF